VNIYNSETSTAIKKQLRNPFHKLNLQKGYTFTADTTPNLLVTGHTDGGLYVWSDLEGSVARTLRGHIADINTVRFFPSGSVILSGGADMILKIWTLAQDGMCAAEFKGHKRGILSTSIIDRGRNIVSTSRDGTAILWDVPSQAIINQWGDGQNLDAVNDCHVSVGVPSGGQSLDSRDTGTDGKILYIATESGKLIGYDMRDRKEVFSCNGKSALNSVTSLPNCIITGANDGVVSSWDIRNNSAPTNSLKASSVNRLIPRNDKQCWVACGDGVTYNWDLEFPAEPEVSLVSDTEPLTVLLKRNNDVITISRKGILRAYSVPDQ